MFAQWREYYPKKYINLRLGFEVFLSIKDSNKKYEQRYVILGIKYLKI